MANENMLTTKGQIARFFKTGINKVDVFMAAGAPIIKIIPPHSTQATYRADIRALEQWMGYKGEDNGLPGQTRQPARESVSTGQA